MPSILAMVGAALQDCLSVTYIIPSIIFFMVIARAVSRVRALADGLCVVFGFTVGLLFNYAGGDLVLNIMPTYFFDWAYILLGIIFLVLSLVFLTDWLKCFRSDHPTFTIRLFKLDDPKQHIALVILFDITLICLGVLVALVCSQLLIADQHVFFAANELLMPDRTLNAMTHLIVYAFSYVFPMILLVFFCFNMLKNDSRRIEFFQLSMARIICAAVFFASGISLVYLYL